MTTQEQRAEWRALEQAATPGEWKPRISELTTDHEVTVYDADYDCTGVVAVCNSGLRYDDNEPNARFIAAARTAVPALLADVDALTQERDAYARDLAERTTVTEQISMAMHVRDTQLTAAIAERDAARAEVMICHGLLESLTPGGSEFSGWPERCAEWARNRVSMTSKIAVERNALQAERDALAAELASYKRQAAYISSVIDSEGKYVP